MLKAQSDSNDCQTASTNRDESVRSKADRLVRILPFYPKEKRENKCNYKVNLQEASLKLKKITIMANFPIPHFAYNRSNFWILKTFKEK